MKNKDLRVGLQRQKPTWWRGSGLGLGLWLGIGLCLWLGIGLGLCLWLGIGFGDVVKGTRCQIKILGVVPAQQHQYNGDRFVKRSKDQMQAHWIRVLKVWHEQ